ncbi:MAG TPA: prolyl oligopeptidase family serine peptidase [Vicinamibacteria bacterium]|nr:prolyl oligopeptidase family serine peptidase [Vicinamibacteria bacterium]
MRLSRAAVPFAVGLPLLVAASGDPAGPPATRRAPVEDRYDGATVVDEYRWLEDGSSPEVAAWTEAQNRYTRSVLDARPGADALRRRVREIRTIEIPRFGSLKAAGGRLFALRFRPPQQQPVLVVLSSVDRPDEARVLVDPNQLDPSGGTSMDWYSPSLDGRLVAVSLAQGGSERGEVHVYEVESGKPLADVVPRVNYGTAGGSLAWDARGEGFYYTRYPRPGERPEADLDFYVQVYHHRLGTPDSQDRYEIGKDFPRIAEIDLRARPDGRYVLANVQNGDGGEFEQHLRREDGSWTRLSRFEDRTLEAVFDPAEESLLLLSRAGAPRGRLLKLALRPTGPLGPPVPFVPEGDGVIESSFSFDPSPMIVPTAAHLYVVEQAGGPQRVRVLDRDGKPRGLVPLPEASAVYQVLPEPGADALLVQSASFVEPTTWYRFRPGEAAGRLEKTALSVEFPISLRDATVSREWAASKDGTRVPLTVVAPKGARHDGTSPALLTGYGGYGISQTPYFDPGLRIWLDHGGVFAVANLRGGGEFGQAWHDAGRLLAKQNVFDDFIACAEHLVKAGYASPRRLAIEGGSNGGLLMGAVLTQRPDLFAAVVSHVGIYDMLRVELSPNGAFNVPEFGSVKDPAQFRALRAYSPYAHVKDGAAYPPVLFPTGANDPRVDPMHSRKMTARLQAATRGRSLVLLRASASSGHGFGTALDERIALEADVWTFLFAQLGMNAQDR